MSHPSKKKGYAFEVECKRTAEKFGCYARRAWGSNGQALDLSEDVDLIIGQDTYQCKKRRKFTQEIFPSVHVEGTIIRADYQKYAYIVLPYPLFLHKYKRAYEQLRKLRKLDDESGSSPASG